MIGTDSEDDPVLQYILTPLGAGGRHLGDLGAEHLAKPEGSRRVGAHQKCPNCSDSVIIKTNLKSPRSCGVAISGMCVWIW